MTYDTSGIRKCILPFVFLLLICIPGCMHLGEDDDPLPTFDLSNVPDGTYLGVHRMNNTEYEVEVVVTSRQISGIKVLKGMERVFVKKCALCKVNNMIWEIIEMQSIEVDAVSSATQTGIAISRAILDALKPSYSPQ